MSLYQVSTSSSRVRWRSSTHFRKASPPNATQRQPNAMQRPLNVTHRHSSASNPLSPTLPDVPFETGCQPTTTTTTKMKKTTKTTSESALLSANANAGASSGFFTHLVDSMRRSRNTTGDLCNFPYCKPFINAPGTRGTMGTNKCKQSSHPT